MLVHYINIPLHPKLFDTDTMTGSKQLEIIESHASPIEAIKQHVNMLLLSQEGELLFDKLFGLEVWNHNFESKILKHDEKKVIEEEIIRDLNEFEHRLKKNNHKVEIQFKDEVKLIDNKTARMRVLEIKIQSVLNEDLKSKENHFNHKLMIPVKVYYKT